MSRSDRAPGNGTQPLAVPPLEDLPVAAVTPQAAGSSIRARSPPFRAEAADQDHATFTPGTTWPAIRATARLIPGSHPQPGSDAVYECLDASTVNPRRGFQRTVFLIPT